MTVCVISDEVCKSGLKVKQTHCKTGLQEWQRKKYRDKDGGSRGVAGVMVGRGCTTDRCPSAPGIPGTFSSSDSSSIRLFFQQEGFLWEKSEALEKKPSVKARGITAWRAGSTERGERWLR
jgi:hypothetical protein